MGPSSAQLLLSRGMNVCLLPPATDSRLTFPLPVRTQAKDERSGPCGRGRDTTAVPGADF